MLKYFVCHNGKGKIGRCIGHVPWGGFVALYADEKLNWFIDTALYIKEAHEQEQACPITQEQAEIAAIAWEAGWRSMADKI